MRSGALIAAAAVGAWVAPAPAPVVPAIAAAFRLPLGLTHSNGIGLTFDDGPSPYTDRLLQILKDNDAKSTFFLIGNKVAANPAGAKRVADAGMEVGNHTWEHPNMTTIPPEDIRYAVGNPACELRFAFCRYAARAEGVRCLPGA